MLASLYPLAGIAVNVTVAPSSADVTVVPFTSTLTEPFCPEFTRISCEVAAYAVKLMQGNSPSTSARPSRMLKSHLLLCFMVFPPYSSRTRQHGLHGCVWFQRQRRMDDLHASAPPSVKQKNAEPDRRVQCLPSSSTVIHHECYIQFQAPRRTQKGRSQPVLYCAVLCCAVLYCVVKAKAYPAWLSDPFM